ncbi:RNI-like protein [Mycena alexandri]|uniref:RNI-like protein n=1 Tax=Mycena alexandri TaxID=1745969 RepID=A0AAD6WKR0_9AGAR|nr:RNI-like protein [Mycena alexandri]
MAGRNVRGPASALTDYLRSTGITPTTIARRVATQTPAQQTEAGPSTSRGAAAEGHNSDAEEGYHSDNLDEPESPPKKQKKTAKTAVSKASASKSKSKKKKKDEDSEEEDPYTELSRSLWTNVPKPAVGSFENCAKCEKQFTMTKYTMASSTGTGYLCHPCAKASGTDPFKKAAAPRKRKTPADKRTVVHIEKRGFPSLVTICIDVIARHIDDVEAFGDIGALNMEAISKALSKNRRLTPDNAPLFYGAENTTLSMYDATNLTPDAFVALGNLNPNLTTLRLDFCGPLNDTVIASWTNALPNLVSLDLFGPFLIREAAWIAFLQSHPNMEAFLITQSPRFSLVCLETLVENSKGTLRRLRLREVGKLCDEWLGPIGELSEVTYLDFAEPEGEASLTDDEVVNLLEAVGANLTHLDLSGHAALSDAVLELGIAPHAHALTSLSLMHMPFLTDAGVAAFFGDFPTKLTHLDLSRNPELGSAALAAIASHSGKSLQSLNINGWKDVGGEELNALADEVRGTSLQRLDVGWCRAMDDFVVKKLLEGCRALAEVRVWGCNRVEGKWGETRRGVKIHGIETAVY